MLIRGLRLPDFDFPPEADELLSSYLSRTRDTLCDLLHSGSRWPAELGADQRTMEVFAGCRALRDREVTPDVHLSGISFAYLLYHWKLLDESFATLEAIDVSLAEEGLGTEDDPLRCSEDPRYVAGLMHAHGRWHGDGGLAEATRRFEGSLQRQGGLQYHGPVTLAKGTCFHRLGLRREARECYEEALDRLRSELSSELAEDEPIFHEELESQVEIVGRLLRRLSEEKGPNAVMTKYGWAMYSTGRYEYWSPTPDWGLGDVRGPALSDDQESMGP